MRERWGQDYCVVCGTATTFAEGADPVCGSSLCEAAFRLPAAKAGQAGAETEPADNQLVTKPTVEGS